MPKRVDVRCDKTGVIFDVNTKRIFVDDITKLTTDQISVLECGDFVVKQTGNQKHTYKVSYKEEEQGLCLTYDDASCIETVSYDYVDGAWVYNSTDISSVSGGGGTTVVANPTLSGGEADLTGLEVNNVKYAVPQGSGGGSARGRYLHELTFEDSISQEVVIKVAIFTNDSEEYTTGQTLSTEFYQALFGAMGTIDFTNYSDTPNILTIGYIDYASSDNECDVFFAYVWIYPEQNGSEGGYNIVSDNVIDTQE